MPKHSTNPPYQTDCKFKNGHVHESRQSSSYPPPAAQVSFFAPRASNLAMATPNRNYEL